MRRYRSILGLVLTATVLALSACSGDDGDTGPAGPTGQAGATGSTGTSGTNGLNCWDLNGNGVADLVTEDVNKDGKVDVDDCRTPTGAYDPVALHKGYFTDNAYTGTSQCLNCHGKIGDDVMTTAHWKWEGVATNIAGYESETHGKKDLINNFCQAVPSNEARCTECHIGIGWKDKNFDFGNPKNIDCLACHDQTGTYKKGTTTAGAPDPSRRPEQGGPERRAERGRSTARDLRVLSRQGRWRRQRQARRHRERPEDADARPRRAHGHGRCREFHVRGLPPGQEEPGRRHHFARHRRHGVPLGGRRRHEDLHRLSWHGRGHPCRHDRAEHRAVAHDAGLPGLPHSGHREEDLHDDRLALGAGGPRGSACDLRAGRPEP